MKKQRIRLPRRDGLVGEWLLNSNTKDTSGNGYNGTPTNVTYSKTDRGYQTYAGNFNGSNAYVTNPSSPISWNFTILFRIKISSNGWCPFGNKYGGNFFYAEFDGSNRLQLVYWNGDTYVDTVSDVLFPGVYYDFAYERIWNVWYLYKNGNLISIWNAHTFDVFWGSWIIWWRLNYWSNINFFNGSIQSVRIFNRALSADEIRDWYLEGLRALGGSSLSGLMDGLVAYYDFRGDANDIIGGNNGTVNGATLTTDRFGTANGAYNFNGSSYIVTNSAPDIYWTQNFTISIWFNPASMSFSNRMKLMNYCESADGWEWDKAIYLLSNGAVWFQIYDWNEKVASTNSGAVSVGNWYQATATYDGNTMKLYLNWELAPNTNTSTAWSYNFSTPKLQIWHVFWTDSRLNWQVWETELFLRALSADEVKALYELSKQSKLLPFA